LYRWGGSVAIRRPRATTGRGRHPLGADFEITQPSAGAWPDPDNIWRDSSIDLEHGLFVDELAPDSLPNEVWNSLVKDPKKE